MTVLAATPNWEDLGIAALPAEVTPGATAAYALKLKNKGPSNISQLYLVTAEGSPVPTFASTSQGSCTLTSPMVCTIGSLRRNATATVIVAFTTPTTGATFSVNFEWNTTGLGSGDNDQSHGDSIDHTGITTLNPDATNFSGKFLLAPGEVKNSQSLSSTNPQTVSVNVPLANVPATVEDGPGVTPGACPFAFCAGWAELHVNSGLPTDFTAFMQLDSSLGLPNANNIQFGHISDLGGPANDIDRCTFRKNDPTPTNIPCFTATNLGGGDVAATFYLDVNGKIFGH